MLVLACLELIVLEGSLIKIAIGEVESSFAQFVFEHEAVEKGAVDPVLLGLACLLSVELGSLKAIFRVIGLYSARDSLDLRRALLGVIAERLALFFLELLNGVIEGCCLPHLSHVGHGLESDCFEGSSELFLGEIGVGFDHDLSIKSW